MLVLSRRRDERIIIADNIIVTYLGVNEYGNAKIGIEAPDAVRIVREELLSPKLPPETVDKPVGIRYLRRKLYP